VIVGVVGLVFFIWGTKSGWNTPAVQEAIAGSDMRVNPS
jgi:hypothetical protein